ncbi:MAG: biotin transporter BioY [Alphaproteobacteria bacterium]|nr:biotin transporter BioY [Alphaproteobacteria bacterium]
MSTATAYPQQTLAGALWPEGSLSQPLRLAVLALAGTALLALSARVQVPFYPVPVTMQTFAVLAIGMAYGWRLGGATLLLYLAEGAAGLPVFAKGGGIATFFLDPATGTTAGYLYGFVLAAAAVGFLAERGWDRNVVTTALAMLIGNVVIYLSGLLWLGAIFTWEKPILEWGLYPFLIGDAFKLALAAAVMPLAWTAVRRWRGG